MGSTAGSALSTDVGLYGVDATIFDQDQSVDELIALAGTLGLEAPENRQADRIAVGGLLLRFSDVDAGDLNRATVAMGAGSSRVTSRSELGWRRFLQ